MSSVVCCCFPRLFFAFIILLCSCSRGTEPGSKKYHIISNKFCFASSATTIHRHYYQSPEMMETDPAAEEAPPQQHNPLLNQLVLAHLFRWCDVSELRQCRAVCRLWRDSCQERWSREVILIVDQYSPEFDDGDDDLVEDGVDEDGQVSSRYTVVQEAPPGSLYIHRSLEVLLEHPYSIPERRYKRFAVEKWNFEGECWSNKVSRFWNLCGPWMLELTLISCKFPELRVFMRILLEETPNLRKLTIDEQVFKNVPGVLPPPPLQAHDEEGGDDGEGGPVVEQKNLRSLTVLYSSRHRTFPVPVAAGRGEYLPVSWFHFLRHFPYLENVVLTFGIGQRWMNNYKNFDNFMKAVKALQLRNPRDRNRLRIQHLDIIRLDFTLDIFPKTTRLLLLDLALPLKTLKMDLGDSQCSEGTITELLQSYAPSLETLVALKGFISAPSSLPHFPFSSSPMTSLTSLELLGQITYNLSFLRHAPNLKRLTVTPIHRTKYMDENFLISSIRLEEEHPQFKSLAMNLSAQNDEAEVKLLKLTDLEIGYVLEDPANIQLLGEWMPNVEKLRMPASPRIFTEICSQWSSSLRRITLLTPSWVDDVALLGLPSPPGANNDPANEVVNNNIVRVEAPRAPPTLCSLTRLTSFEMEHPHSEPEFYCSHRIPRLTDRVITGGLLTLEELQNMTVYLVQGVSESCSKLLAERMRRPPTSSFNYFCGIVRGCKCNGRVLRLQELAAS